MVVVHEDLNEEKIHLGFSAEKATYTVTRASSSCSADGLDWTLFPQYSTLCKSSSASLEHVRKGLGLFLRLSSLIFPAMGICADDIPCHMISRSSG